MEPVLGLLRAIEDAAHLEALAPGLTLRRGAPTLDEAGPPPPSDESAERRWLAAEGLVTLAGVETAATCSRIASGITGCLAAGYPAVLVYVFDEVWQLGARVAARVSALTSHDYTLAPDAWAWRIEPGRGRGWPPHRGLAAPRFDRDAPEVVNVWIALTDAGAERSCMHFVPLDEDPGYPNAMDRVDAPLDRARAVPVSAATAVVWNANVLHWGGPCSARAAGPRISCSFTLCRTDALASLDMTAVDLAALDLRARIDFVAHQIVVYGEGQPDVTAEMFGWARTVAALSALPRLKRP